MSDKQHTIALMAAILAIDPVTHTNDTWTVAGWACDLYRDVEAEVARREAAQSHALPPEPTS